MKESITKFDLEAAFKALDEIDIPQNNEGIKANRPALTEIFSNKTKLDALIEEYYDVGNTEDLNNAKEAREAEVAKAKLARIEKIVDLDAESPEDLLTSYVGKLIMQCPQCMTLFYKNQEDVVEDEADPTTVNVGEACQHCGNETGYILVGKVGEVTSEEAKNYQAEDETEIDVQGTTEDEDDLDLSDADLAGEELDLEDLDLDFDIEDDEAEQEKEESFNTAINSQILVEDLTESKESLDDFEALLKSDEFKKPISDQTVRAMIQDLDESKNFDNQPAIDGFNYEILDTFEDEGFTGQTIRYSKNDKEIVEIEFWGYNEPISVTTNIYAPNLMDKVYDSFDAFSQDLIAKTSKLEDLQDTLNEGVFSKLKDKIEDAINSVADKLKTREARADWILQNALKAGNEVTLDKHDNPIIIDDARKFTKYVIIGFTNKDANDKDITKAPTPDNEDLIMGMEKPEVKNTYKDAENKAKGWSMRQENGPAFIYLAQDSEDAAAAFLCQYFDGKLDEATDMLDKYFEAVKKDLKGAKLEAKSSITTKDKEEPKDPVK